MGERLATVRSTQFNHKTMTNQDLETAVNELRERLAPFGVTPLEWALLPTGRTSSEYGLALSIALIPTACSPNVLTEIVGIVIETLRTVIAAASLVGFQITVRGEFAGQVRRVYRIGVPAERFDQVLSLEVLPDKSGEILPGVHASWYQRREDDNGADDVQA